VSVKNYSKFAPSALMHAAETTTPLTNGCSTLMLANAAATSLTTRRSAESNYF